MHQVIIATFVLSFYCFGVNGQIHDKNIRSKVLEKEIVDSTFIFGSWAENGQTETHLKYLGKVKTKKGKIFKMVNSTWFWGLSRRATSRILIFNGKNQYVGNYYLTTVSNLPSRLVGTELIFINKDSDCDKMLRTVVDLKKGLPNQFFKKCNDGEGTIYKFENN